MRRTDSAPDEPFVVARTAAQKRVIHAVSPQASAEGLRIGGTVALAQAKVPGLNIVEADPRSDAHALDRLALWCLRFTPLAAPDGEDGIILDTGGADHLMGGEEALLENLLEKFGAADLTVYAGLSSSRTLSHALARFGTSKKQVFRIISPSQEVEAAGPLPVPALDLDSTTTSRLRHLGFDRIGQLFAAPRAGLALRFGTDLIRRLDRITGREPELLEPVVMPELISADVQFLEPIGHTSAVEKALERLAGQLCPSLERAGCGARVLDLRCFRVDGEVSPLRVRTTSPTRTPAHICRLFQTLLDRVDSGFGIERMMLTAPVTEKIGTHQQSTGEERKVNLAPLVDAIAARIGERHIFRIEPTERDFPERSAVSVAPFGSTPSSHWNRRRRPVQLIQPPQPIMVTALLPDHPPARFTWQGSQHRVLRADGPECLFGEWWWTDDEVSLTRDYYRVEDENGGRYWLFRARDTAAGTSSWYVHGIFG